MKFLCGSLGACWGEQDVSCMLFYCPKLGSAFRPSHMHLLYFLIALETTGSLLLTNFHRYKQTAGIQKLLFRICEIFCEGLFPLSEAGKAAHSRRFSQPAKPQGELPHQPLRQHSLCLPQREEEPAEAGTPSLWGGQIA